MKRLLLPLLFISSIIENNSGIIKSKFKYSLSLYYESNLNTNQYRSCMLVDGKQIRCICGGDPVLLLIIYGHIQGFCLDHLPTIDINFGHDCRCKEICEGNKYEY